MHAIYRCKMILDKIKVKDRKIRFSDLVLGKEFLRYAIFDLKFSTGLLAWGVLNKNSY